ncbi:MAG: Crp/Fnr family transcriptional regulator [Gammaproteobacteria bacterium]|nr:Crp/Fnr family transcriptional regulator [Gammaproteobacteria bacterium]
MKQTEKKLLNIYRKLNETDQQTLEKFANFLQSNAGEEVEPLAEPVLIEAKVDETVVGALKRLSASYPMLDLSIMLNKTSTLMTQHILQGRIKEEVIPELESVFAEQYLELQNQELKK